MIKVPHRLLHFKNTTVKTLFLITIAAFCFIHTQAQKHTGKTKPELKRCGTMEGLEKQMLTDPELKARVEQNERDFEAWQQNKNNGVALRPASPSALPDSVVIPVVVHIVLPNPWIIPDEAVDNFIARLNKDFSGTNADSTNGAAFYDRRGHSKLRFTRAKRDPQGNYTTGIVRKVSGEIIGSGNPQRIKNDNTGGSTGWDVTQYYNLYVGNGSAASLLGISPSIGPGSAAGTTNADGVCVDYRSFANLCFSYDGYTLSRTAVHEIGHNFGLYHIWGDNRTCVTGIDFQQLSSAGCSLPAALLGSNDDTPNQSGNTQGCPSGSVNNGCNPAEPKMYQNYMDYTQDACYSMFTKGQVRRMEWVLENCRSGYLTTLGGQYPTQFPLDAMINSVVSPGGAEAAASGCDSKGVLYPAQTCTGPFTPKLRITNAGTTPLTSITVTTSVNGLSVETETFTVNIAPGRSQVLTLHVQNAVVGANALKFVLSAPNGGTDGNPANDELTVNFNTGNPISLPFTENFESTTFPPDNGSFLVNPDGGFTWQRANTGRPGPGCMKMDFFNYDGEGQRDIFGLPPLPLDPYDSIQVSFYVAYQQYEDRQTAPLNDSLILVYSADCGGTWQRTDFAKGGSSLRTVANSDNEFTPNNASQWRKETVTLKNFCERGLRDMRIGFQSYNDFGNNLYVDSITITGFNTLGSNTILANIETPSVVSCSGQFSPAVSFSNATTDTLRNLTIKYVIDHSATDTATYHWTGSIAKCEYGTAILAPANVSIGTHVIDVFTSEPNGNTDLEPSNDKLSKTFSILTNQDMPITEDFEGTVFPAANWGIFNVTGGTTWEKGQLINPTNGALLIKNFSGLNTYNAIDYFITPIINNAGEYDSVFVDFDMAYEHGVNYPAATNLPLDTLELLVTKDCGATFTSVWKKWGTALQTTTTPDFQWDTAFAPKASEWKKQRVNLTTAVGTSGFQLYWAMKGNKQNNMWLDNINVYSQKRSQLLEEQGYLIYPNPFNSTFSIQHATAEQATRLQGIQVYNAAGQLVWSKQYNGNAERQVTVNLNHAAKGVYILKMIYSNRTVVERVVKTQ